VTKTLVPATATAVANGCNSARVDSSELWEGSQGVVVELPASSEYGPGMYLVPIVPSDSGSELVQVPPSCQATVTVIPCTPACASPGSDNLPSIIAPLDTCESPEWPAGLLETATVSTFVAPVQITPSPASPFRVGQRSASLTLAYAGGVATTSPSCRFRVRDTQVPVAIASPRCIQPKNGVNSFGSTSVCFSPSQLVTGTDNCPGMRYSVANCRNLRPLLQLGKPNPCFFGPTLACVNIRNAPPPSDLSRPRTLQVALTASDASSNRVSVTSSIDIYYQPKEGCQLV
jgi:hypothetical protein